MIPMLKAQKLDLNAANILTPASIKNEQIEKINYNAALANSSSIELGDQMELVSAKSPSENDKAANQEDFTRQAMDYRRKFYTFHRILESIAPRINDYAKDMKQHLIVKIPRILDHSALADHFERQLYKLAKNPKQTKKNWSEEETILLVSLITYYCYINSRDFNVLGDEVWNFIAEIYPGKKAEHLRLRWFNIYKIKLDKAPWTPVEDDILFQIIQEKGPQHWKSIAIELNDRSGLGIYRQGKQCRERWINHLDPSIKKGGWNEEEDLNLLKFYIELGKKWAEIAKRLGGRTENGVKNRWISLIKRYKTELDDQTIRAESEEDNLWERKIAQAIVDARMTGENEQDFSALKARTKAEEKKDGNAAEEAEKNSSNKVTAANVKKDKKKEVAPPDEKTNASKKKGSIAPTKIEADSSGKAVSKTSKIAVKNKPPSSGSNDIKNPLTKNLEREEFTKPKKLLSFNPSQAQQLLPVGALRPDLLDSNQIGLLTDRIMSKNPFMDYLTPKDPFMVFPDHRDRQFSLNGRPLGIPHLDIGGSDERINGLDFTRLLNSTNPLLFNLPEGMADEEAGYLVQNNNGEAEEGKVLPTRRIGGSVNYPWEANKAEEGDSGEVFNLRAKNIDAVDTEQLKDDSGNLFFAVVDTRKEEIYFVNMASKDNYQKSLRAIRGFPEDQLLVNDRTKNQLRFGLDSHLIQQTPNGMQSQQALSQLASRLNQSNQAQNINQRVQQMAKNPQQMENDTFTELMFPFNAKYY